MIQTFLLKVLPLVIAGMATLSNNAYGQGCSGLKKGTKMTLEVKNYPLIHDKVGSEFYTMKPKKKIEKAAAYKAELDGGSVAPANTMQLIYSVTDINKDNEYELTTNIAGTDYKSYTACNGDATYLVRIKGGMQPMVYNNDTMGFYTKGVQVVPNNLKIGDFTPGYIDESIVSIHAKQKWNSTFALSDASTSSAGTYISTYSGHVNANVDYDVTGKILTFYQGGQVFGEETLTISGKPYKCYKVRTEIWTKNNSKTKVTFEKEKYFNDPALNKRITEQLQTITDKVVDKMALNIDEQQGVNKAGYLVTYKEEWISPGVGLLKGMNYDQWGCLTTMTTVTSID